MLTDKEIIQILEAIRQHGRIRGISFRSDVMIVAIGQAIKRINALHELRQDFLDCCLYDAMMEGPAFKGYNRSALDRLRKALEKAGEDE